MTDDPQRRWIVESLEFQAAALDELESQAGADGAACAAWLALERQCDRTLDSLRTSWAAAWLDPHREVIDAHRRTVEAIAERARRGVASFAPAERAAARRRLGIRVAVIGKGGAGKSMVSGTLARVLARSGERVLSADLDTAPGLSYSLGMPDAPTGLPADAVEMGEGRPPRIAGGLSPGAAVERFAAAGPDGVRYLGIGKHGGPSAEALQRSVGPVLQVLFNFGPAGWSIVADLEAGPRQPSQGLHLFADVAVVVLTPMWKSSIGARRIRSAAGRVPALIVVNRYAGQPDHPELAAAVCIPEDPAVLEADRHGRAPVDHCPGSPAVAAIEEVALELRRRALLGDAEPATPPG